MASTPNESVETTLSADRSFLGITSTQFLGAFNDNVFKQVILLLFVAVPQPDGTTADRQWLALFVFALPFVLFSGIAGFLSDRYAKHRVIWWCKIAELGIMALGVGAFQFFAGFGLVSTVVTTLAGLLFLMGTQSAFFGPSKYGILPELFPEKSLPSANGLVLMTTFIAIILGSALAGLLVEYQGNRLWIIGVVCCCIAILGIATASMIRRLAPAEPQLVFHRKALGIPQEIRKLLSTDRQLLVAALVTSVFWMTAALIQPAVNALGDIQLGESPARTSWLVTSISIGIAIGSVIAGALSKNQIKWWLLRCGATGIVTTLMLLSIAPNGHHWLGYVGSMLTLISLGVFTGMFAVPLQVFLQSRPPKQLKGRMIATQNLLNWIGILLSAGIYFLMGRLTAANDWPSSARFAMTAMFMLPIVLFYRPQITPNATNNAE